jgi:hypothetical protein
MTPAQAKQEFPAGTITYRWYVHTPGKRLVSWAKTADEARRKAEKRGLFVESVKPAPDRLSEVQP